MSTESQIEQALTAMRLLLAEVGNLEWAAWLDRDLQLWHETQDVARHLSAYGGMGSLNDVVLCRANGLNLSPDQEPWADSLFQLLKSLCYSLAQNGGSDLPVKRLRSQLAARTNELSGWRCLSCGHSETTRYDLEVLVAHRYLPGALVAAIDARRLAGYVLDVLALDLPEAAAARLRIEESCSTAGVRIASGDGWMRPCPSCGSQDTARYRWLVNGGLSPAPDNLRLRRGTA